MRSYAIGDIHGHLGPLLEAHARIAADRDRTGDAEAPVIHLGDLVDRGPDSRGVIACLVEGIAAGAPWEVLLGNHDRYFKTFLTTGSLVDPRLPDYSWMMPSLGGNATLASYGLARGHDLERLARDPRDTAALHADALEMVPPEHVSFLTSRPTSLRRGEVFFAHAGVRPGVGLDRQVEDDLVWIREPFLSDRTDHGPLVVHGHTAIRTASHHGNRVNIDSSMAFGGHLTAVVIEGREVWELTGNGRQPLRP